MQFLEKCADTGERHVSTPQSSSARDDTIDLPEDVENVPPESSPVAELGRNPKPKRRPSNTVLEQLSTAVNDAEKSKMDDFEISCLSLLSTLRNIAKYDDALAYDWKLKVDEMQLEAARDAARLMRRIWHV
ncbi:unnamed protein product [Nippostrongylus brasiliensis]|uniref:DUF4378 domain-containing protein n=1 Tax=Nippostrongylus brasiliensis TaxID=27835 RepID=A0A0N4XSC1_NIPBR|nr:unnamed protein product [Nippostrongylus brasiliensis]